MGFAGGVAAPAVEGIVKGHAGLELGLADPYAALLGDLQTQAILYQALFSLGRNIAREAQQLQRQRQPGVRQTPGNRLRREARPMLDATKALFFCGVHQHAIANETGGGIAVECVYSKDSTHF